jgi:hypothetical protein
MLKRLLKVSGNHTNKWRYTSMTTENEPTIPKGFVMIYTETHSICMRVDHIVSVAVSCGVNHTLHITTRDGETYKAAYNFEEFLRIMAEEGDNTNE